VMENNKHKLVGAPRFELGTSCAQGRHSAQNNPPVFNATTETKQLSRDRRMWLAVRECPQMFVGWAQKLAHSNGVNLIRVPQVKGSVHSFTSEAIELFHPRDFISIQPL
jgi:hypothetical protein